MYLKQIHITITQETNTSHINTREKVLRQHYQRNKQLIELEQYIQMRKTFITLEYLIQLN